MKKFLIILLPMVLLYKTIDNVYSNSKEFLAQEVSQDKIAALMR